MFIESRILRNEYDSIIADDDAVAVVVAISGGIIVNDSNLLVIEVVSIPKCMIG